MDRFVTVARTAELWSSPDDRSSGEGRMAAIDIGRAATAGFRLIASKPLAVLAWAGVLFVVGVLPVAGLMSAFFGAIAEMVQAEAAGQEPSPEAMLPMMSAVFAMQPILLIAGIAVRAIVTAAVFRAVLEPGQGRWFYLRLGAEELWLALMIAVIGILLSLLAFPAALVIMPVAMIGAVSAEGDPAAIIAPTLIAVLAFGALYAWVLVRFSMALPMTFAQRQFRLFESWTLTRGHTLRLLGVGVVLVAIVLVLELVVALAFVGISFALHGSGGFDEAAVTAFFAQDASIWMAELAPWAIGVAVLGALLGAVLSAITIAPWADAYRQLSGAEPSA